MADIAIKIKTDMQQQQKQLIMRHGRTKSNVIGRTIASITSWLDPAVVGALFSVGHFTKVLHSSKAKLKLAGTQTCDVEQHWL